MMGKEGDIINQYVAFTKIYNEPVKLHAKNQEAVLETNRICKDQNVLGEYLSGREKEVVDTMMTLFNEEYTLKTYAYNALSAFSYSASVYPIDNICSLGYSL